jgi:hypothetical protein
MHLVKTLICTAVVLSVFPAFAQTAAWDKVTTVTINEPIEVPGAGVLQPGTYTFKLVDVGQGANRHMVQILNKDQTHVYATVQAIPNERLQPAEKSVFLFYEMPKGQPEAMRAWFYPGDNMGQEFAYPKNRAAELTQSANQPVPVEIATAQPQTAPEPVLAPARTPDPPAVEPAPIDSAPVTSSNPPESVTADSTSNAAILAQNSPPQSNSQNTNELKSTPQTLPHTGSDLPLLGMAGLGFLAVASFLRFAPLN